MPTEPTTAVQDHLKAIHRLGGAGDLVSTARLAEHLDLRSPSVTGMLKRLGEHGWILYEPSRGARLSPAGLTEALRVIRRHRLVETFLADVLGLDWSEVDAEAEALEHAISPRLEEAIARYLGDPGEDPHGHPIPTAQGTLPTRDLKPLCDYRDGDTVVIREVQDDNPARLVHWQKLGLKPGVVVTVVSYQPLDDIFELSAGGQTLRMGSEGLAGLRGEVRRTPPPD